MGCLTHRNEDSTASSGLRTGLFQHSWAPGRISSLSCFIKAPLPLCCYRIRMPVPPVLSHTAGAEPLQKRIKSIGCTQERENYHLLQRGASGLSSLPAAEKRLGLLRDSNYLSGQAGRTEGRGKHPALTCKRHIS